MLGIEGSSITKTALAMHTPSDLTICQIDTSADGEITEILTKLTNPNKTKSQKDFSRLVAKLTDCLQRVRNSTSTHKAGTAQHVPSTIFSSQVVLGVIQRCLSQKVVWSDALVQLISVLPIQGSVLTELIHRLIEKDKAELIYSILPHLSDIPETDLVKLISYFLSMDAGENIVESPDQTTGNDAVLRCPLSQPVAKYIKSLLQCSYNDTFFFNALKKVKFQHILVLLQYLNYLLWEPPLIGDEAESRQEEVIPCVKQSLQVIDWMTVLIDSHGTQLVLTSDAKPILDQLQSAIEKQLFHTQELVNLELMLSQVRERHSMSRTKNIGQYCIEVLQVP